MAFKFNYEQFDAFIGTLKEEFKIFAPVRLKGMGRFSDTDVVRYGEINKAVEIVTDEKSGFSPKEILFPITQTLFYFFNGEDKEPREEKDKVIIFLRPCDINGMEILDNVFLYNGRFKDTYYEKLRRKVYFFMLECKESFDNCFCVSMNTNRTDRYDAAIRFEKDEILCQVKNTGLLPVFSNHGTPVQFEPEFVTENRVKVHVPEIEEMTPEFFEHELWKEYSERCIACGRCNFACPTCSCWTMQDVTYTRDRSVGERRRVWAGCHVDGFTDMAGGHGFRKNYGDRMRFKTLHKIYDYKKRNGRNMCVGCGRCDDICPEYISFSNCLNKLAQIKGRKKE